MANELFIPVFPTSSNLDAALATSIADYSRTITDNIYNANVVLKILSERKKLVDGGASLNITGDVKFAYIGGHPILVNLN